MQHLDYEPVITERPGELIAYYKIARKDTLYTILNCVMPLAGDKVFPMCYQFTTVFSGHYKWALDQLFYKHNFNRVIILEGINFKVYH